MRKEIDNEYTEQIVCPYCGDTNDDSWEYDSDEGEVDCPSCEKRFHYQRHRDISYTTYK